MDKKGFVKTAHVVINGIVILAFLLGMLNIHSTFPVIASAEQAAPQISEGDSLHLYLQNGEPLEFLLSLAEPVGLAVNWQVKVPASFGQVEIVSQGAKAVVRYLSLEALTSVDYFIIRVTDAASAFDEIRVFVEPDPNRAREQKILQSNIEMSQKLMAQSNEQSRDSVNGDQTFVTPEQEFASIEETPILPVNEPATGTPFGERVSLSYDWLSLMPEPVIDLPSLEETPAGPYLDVNYDQDKVWGYQWPAEVLVELKINGTTFGTETSGTDGGVYFEVSDIGPEDTLVLQDSMTTREYTILPLAYDGNDQVNDLISGTTAANTPVDVLACDLDNCATVSTTADENGVFTADFSTQVDIAPGSDGTIRAMDADGDATRVDWYLQPSEFVVNPDDNAIWGMHWPPSTEITVTRGGDSASTMSNEFGEFSIKPYELGMDIQPGELITVTGATTTKTHTVWSIEITGADEATDTISGTTTPGAQVTVHACTESECEEIPATADGAGDFSAGFSLDVKPGVSGSVWGSDEDFDRTEVFWRIPNPRFTVNQSMQYVWGEDWVPGSTLTLTVEGTDVATTEVNPNGNPFIDTSAIGITTGQTVTLTDGSTTRTLVVQNLSLTAINEVEDTLTGKADPGTEIWADTGDGAYNASTIADGFGDWVIDFTDQIDLVKGAYGFVRIFDDDRDWTEWYWKIFNPCFAVDPEADAIWGWDWQSGTTIELTVNGTPYPNTVIVGGDGSFNFDPLSLDLQVGDEIGITDGTTSKATIISPLTIDEVDPVTDTITGSTTAFAAVLSHACDDNHCADLNITAVETGGLSADMSLTGFDIAPGSWGFFEQSDEDGDGTQVKWQILNLTVNVDPSRDEVWGFQWPANTEVTIEVSSQSFTAWTDGNGFFITDKLTVDIQVGEIVTVTAGGYQKTHQVVEIAITGYDLENNMVSGTTEAFAPVEVSACDEFGCATLQTTANNFGNWIIDYSELIDLHKGMWLYAGRTDEDGDSSVSSMRIPDPAFAVDPRKNTVWGWDWPANSVVSISLPGETIDWSVNENGDFGTDWLAQDIQVGDEVIVTDDTVIKSHTVLYGEVTGYDLDLETVEGATDPNIEITVQACDNFDCQQIPTTADAGGHWGVNFDGTKDIHPNMELAVLRWDEDGDRTEATVYIPNPSFAVNPDNDNVSAWDWPANTELTLTIGEFTTSQPTDEKGNVNFGYVGFNLKNGDVLEVTDGSVVKTHTLLELSLTALDQVADTVSGVAAPESWVNVWACDQDNCNGMDFQADAKGIFVADVRLMGIDIAPGTNGNIARWDEDNDGTVIDWKVLKPAFDVDPDTNHIWGWEWPANTPIEILVGSITYETSTNENGDFDTWEIQEDIIPGNLIQVTGGSITKTHTVLDLLLLSYDEKTDVVTGTAPTGSAIWVGACDRDNCDGMEVFADEAGFFTADMSTLGIDIAPGANGSIRRSDDDNDGTCINWFIPFPSFAVNPEQDNVWGWQWPAMAEVEMIVDGNSFSTTTNEKGDFDFGGVSYDIQVGDEVQVNVDTKSKTHLVLASAITGYDLDKNTITGLTDADATIRIRVCGNGDCQEKETTADSLGNWTVDFTGLKDLDLGMDINALRWDEDGDSTEIYLRIPKPQFAVSPVENNAWGWDWQANTSITLTINDTTSYSTTTNGYGEFGFGTFPLDLEVGDVIEVTDGATTKTHQLQNLELIGLSPKDDTVEGRADAEVWVNTWACGDYGCYSVDTLTNGDGYFSADLSTIGIDLQPGTDGNIGRWDEDGDGTVINWHVKNPSFDTDPEANAVWGWEWPANVDIEISIHGNSYSATTNENGDFNLDDILEDIQIDDVIFVNDGTTFKNHQVLPISFTGASVEEDTVSGVAQPDREVGAWACNNDGCYGKNSVASGDGSFTVDLSDGWDLQNGQWGGVRIWDEDGDGTAINFRLADPSFAVNPVENSVWGWDWPASTMLTLTVHGETFQGETNFWGDLNFGSLEMDLVTGDVLTLSDGLTTKTHTIFNLAFEGYNLDEDTVNGTADPGAPVHVWACLLDQCQGVDPSVDGEGNWTADFSGKMDLVQGTEGGIQIVDEDHDDTRIYWGVPTPSIKVFPDDDMNLVAGVNWLAGATVELTIDDVLEDTQTASADGTVEFLEISKDLSAGMVIQLSDGVTTRTHKIIDLAITNVDEDLDQVCGIGDPGDVTAFACNGTTCATKWVVAADDHIWMADFSREIDITTGAEGGAYQFDAEGNSTRTFWALNAPYIMAGLDSDLIQAFDFKPGNSVELKVDGNVIDSRLADEWGNAEFDLSGSFDVVAGQQIMVSDGIMTKALQVMPLAVTEMDAESDMIIGTAAAGAELFVAAFDATPPGTGVTVTANEYGVWQANFAGYEDIAIGTGGYVNQWDEDEDGTTLAYMLKNPVPVLSSLSPRFTTAGAPGTTLTVNGQNFSEGYSTVLWNGDPRATTFISDTRLSIELSAEDLAVADNATVEVFTAEPGGGYTDPDLLFPIIGVSPFNGQKLATDTVMLDWDAIPGANQYRVQLSLDSQFTTMLINVKTADTAYKYLTPLTIGKTYYWRIQPRFGTTWGDWSPTLKFFAKNPPAVPDLESPVNGYITNQPGFPLSWKTALRGDHYQVQVAKDSLFTMIVKSETLLPGVTTYPAPGGAWADGQYYWRVRAFDEVNVKGKWSEVRSFKVDTKAPNVTILVSPKDGGVKAKTPTFYWLVAAGAKKYYFEYGTTPGFTMPEYTSPALTTLYFKPPAMAEGTYYWRIRAKDKAGNESLSVERRIIIDLP